MENELIKSEESPQNLISLAIEKGANIEQLEKLLSLKERWDAAQANKSFIAAMSNFQKEVPAIEKKKLVKYPSKTGGNVTYKYAELGEIDETIKGAMAANGLSKRWEIKEEGEKLICTCIISHVDGHTESTSMSSGKDTSGGKNEIQSTASAISYLQRYTLIGVLGLTTATEDNDGDGTPAAKHEDAPVYQEDTREWLSEAKFNEGLKRIQEGEEGVYDALNVEFKMKKTYREVLKTAKPIDWKSEVKKCKSKQDILNVYNSHRSIIDSRPDLQNLLKQTQNSLLPQTV